MKKTLKQYKRVKGVLMIFDFIGGILNWKYQADTLKYKKNIQLRQWEREDSAVQRRTDDLRKAGLSPVLAAGQSAQSGPVVNVDPIRTGLDKTTENALAMMNMLKLKEDITKTRAERNLLSAKAGRELHNLKIEKASGVTSSNNSAFGRIIKDLTGLGSQTNKKRKWIPRKKVGGHWTGGYYQD